MTGSRLAALDEPVTLTVGALAVYRLTRLVVDDEVTRPLRDLAGDDLTRPLAYLVSCPWCVSPYVGAAWAALTVYAPRTARAAGAVLAWSAVSGLLSSWE